MPLSHLHTQVRAAVVAALSGLATSSARVYTNRLYPMAPSDLPGLRISADDEDVTVESVQANPLLSRRIALVETPPLSSSPCWATQWHRATAPASSHSSSQTCWLRMATMYWSC